MNEKLLLLKHDFDVIIIHSQEWILPGEIECETTSNE